VDTDAARFDDEDGSVTVKETCAWAVAPLASVAWTVKRKVPGMVGSPLMVPPAATVSPAFASAAPPETTDQQNPWLGGVDARPPAVPPDGQALPGLRGTPLAAERVAE
jgi:hypothetical protein